MSALDHVVFLFCVALATGAQTLTGFAFGLVLLALTSVLDIAPLAEVTNVVSVLVLVNLASLFIRRRPKVAGPQLWPAMVTSLLFIPVGLWLLHRFSAGATQMLQILLGLTILGCAGLLAARTTPRAQISSRREFAVVGGFAGVLSGLFSASGPPMVYLFYRQPMALDLIRNSLLVMFAGNALFRLGLVAVGDGFTMQSVWMSLEAVPVVMGMTWLVQRFGPTQSATLIRRMVLALLAVAGLGLLLQGGQGLFVGA